LRTGRVYVLNEYTTETLPVLNRIGSMHLKVNFNETVSFDIQLFIVFYSSINTSISTYRKRFRDGGVM